MKVRNGFVSNSSTSSFCIIGVHDSWDAPEWIPPLLEAVGINPLDVCGVQEGEILDFVGGESGVFYAGVDAEALLQTMTIPAACGLIKNLIKEKLGVDIPLEKIGFYYGYVETG